MNALLIYPKFPDTYWSFKHALSFQGKREMEGAPLHPRDPQGSQVVEGRIEDHPAGDTLVSPDGRDGVADPEAVGARGPDGVEEDARPVVGVRCERLGRGRVALPEPLDEAGPGLVRPRGVERVRNRHS